VLETMITRRSSVRHYRT